MDSYVKRIEDGWDDTKKKAQTRLDLLNNTKNAWVGYGQGLEDIAGMFEQAEDEMTKIKKRYNLQAAKDDLAKRQKMFNDTKGTINKMHESILHNYDVMTMTLPEDKKDFIKKEIKAVAEKLEVVDRYDTKVKGLENFVTSLSNFDQSLKDIDVWMKEAENQLGDIKNNSDKMTPEDRVSLTMDLQEDIHDKVMFIDCGELEKFLILLYKLI